MHDPKGRWFAKTAVYRFLARNHYLHHRFPGRRFNVVLPFADHLLGASIKPLQSDLRSFREMGF